MGDSMRRPSTSTAPTYVGQAADLPVRFLARVVDALVVGLLYVVATAILVGTGADDILGGRDGVVGSTTKTTLGALLYLGYFAVTESRGGQSAGKVLLHLQTLGPRGGTPTADEALRRNLWSAFPALGVVPFLGGALGVTGVLVSVVMIATTVRSSPTHQGWHDLWAGGTTVVREG